MYYQRPPVASPTKPARSKLPYVIVIFILLLAGFVYIQFFRTTDEKPVVTKPKTLQAVQSNPDAITFYATGDWIAHDSVNAAAKQADGSYDYLPLVHDFTSTFKRADVRFCNDPILNGGESLGITGYPKFNSPTDFVTSMGAFGCNLVNTASNHSFDFTQQNITNSVDAWAKVPNTLAVAGQNRTKEEHDTVHYFTVKGVKFAFLAYTAYINSDSPTQNDYGVNVFTRDFASSQIATAKQAGAKFIIASMRWGTEYSATVNAQQTSDAQFLADQGVNVVLGHGPHELQPVAELTGSGGNKTLVWYSLGNFLNSQEPPETLFNGIAGLTVNTKTLAISNVRYSPIYMHYEWTLADAAADNTNARTKLHLYPLEKATDAMIEAQRLKTTVAAQQQRIQSTLNAQGMQIPLVPLSKL